jgi:hypothetical protein
VTTSSESMRSMWVVFAVAATLVAVTARAQNPGPGASLAGAWRLDPGRSEDAREKMRALRERREGRPGGGFGGGVGGRGGWSGRGGGFGGRGGDRGGRRDGASFEAVRQAMDSILEAPESMAVTIGPGQVEIASKDGTIRRMRPDGRKVKHEDPPSESLARWEGQTLINETWFGRGASHIVEVFALQPDARELVVNLRIENRRFGGEPITVKRVYVAELSPSAPSSGGR